MQPTKYSGKILGFLFLASVFTGGAGTFLRGLSGSESNTTTFLIHIFENSNTMKLAISLDTLGSAISVAIAIFLFPFISQYSKRIAMAYFSTAIINFVVIAVSNLVHYGLITLAAAYDTSTTSNIAYFTTLSEMLFTMYYAMHFLMLLIYGVGGLLLFYYLAKTHLVPKWLAYWGMAAATIVFVGGGLQLADIEVSFLLFGQNGIMILFFIGWLLVKGFHIKDLKKK